MHKDILVTEKGLEKEVRPMKQCLDILKTDLYGSQSLDEQSLGSEHLIEQCIVNFCLKYNSDDIKSKLWRLNLSIYVPNLLEIFNGWQWWLWNSASFT